MTGWGEGEDGPDDAPGWPSPPSPDDRLWRHPSELSANAGLSGSAGPAGMLVSPHSAPQHPGRSLGRPALTVLAGVVIGAALATAGVVLMGSGSGSIEPAASRTGASSGGASTGGSSAAVTVATTAVGAGAAEVGPVLTAPVDRVYAGVVRVEVERDGKTVVGCGFSTGSATDVVTAAALLRGAAGVSVVDASGARSLAMVLGADPVTGVAVLRVPGPGPAAMPATGPEPSPGDVVLAPTPPLTRDAARPARPVLAMGEVVAVGVSTAGLEAAAGGTASGGAAVYDAMSTDLPVGAAGLGTPVLDRQGRPVGMVVSVGSDQPTLVVPMDVAADAASQLASSGQVAHGWLGLGSVVASSAGLSVTAVTPAGPAADAGLRAGDIIVAVDGNPARSSEDLWARVRLGRPGAAVELEVSRPPRTWTVHLVMADLPRS